MEGNSRSEHHQHTPPLTSGDPHPATGHGADNPATGHGHAPGHEHDPGKVGQSGHQDEHADDPAGMHVCCRDTMLVINRQSFDLARAPVTIEFCGFSLTVAYSAKNERSPGERRIEKVGDYEIAITGPDAGDLRSGRPPGRLFINDRHIEYDYEPATGHIRHSGLFGIYKSLSGLARDYIRSNPLLDEIEHHGHH